MPSAAVRRLSPLQWAGVGLGGCAVLLALLGLLAPASAFFFPLLSLWASVGSLFWPSAFSVWQA